MNIIEEFPCPFFGNSNLLVANHCYAVWMLDRNSLVSSTSTFYSLDFKTKKIEVLFIFADKAIDTIWRLDLTGSTLILMFSKKINDAAIWEKKIFDLAKSTCVRVVNYNVTKINSITFSNGTLVINKTEDHHLYLENFIE